MDDDSYCYVKNDNDIAYRTIDGEGIVVNLKLGIFHVLDTVATFIWEQLDGKTSLKQLTDKICAEFDINQNTAKEDCIACINDFLRKEILLQNNSN